MSLLSGFKTDESIANEQDSVGNGGAIDTGIYGFKVAMAYVMTSKGGATGVVLHLKTVDNREVRQTLWISSGDSKGNKNYYETKDGERRYLPGFNLFQSLCLLTVGKDVHEMDTENKTINVYSPEAKKEVATEMPVLMDLLDQEVFAGVFKQTVDKTQKNEAGDYIPTGETRDENELDKFFRAEDKLTTAEIRAGVEEAVFYDTWSKKWTGVTRDKTSKDSGKAGAPAAASNIGQTAATSMPTNSLFSQKQANG